MRRVKKRAVVVGFDYYSAFLAKLVNGQSDEWHFSHFPSTRVGTVEALFACVTADAVVTFGGPGPNAAVAELASFRGIPVFVIWAGSDVITAARDPHLLELLKHYRFVNVADGEWLVGELAALGVKATYLAVTAVQAAREIAPLPKDFTVLTYLPEPRRDFYGQNDVFWVAKHLPDVKFYVVGKGSRPEDAPPNVTYLGYVSNMPAQIDRSTVLLRLPEHDGKSMLVLEVLARARHVVWTHAFPGVRYARNRDAALAHVQNLYELHRSGRLEENAEGYAHARDRFNPVRIVGDLIGLMNNAHRVKHARARRVAISGHRLFVGQQAQMLAAKPNGWVASVLRTEARLEVLTSMFALMRSKVWYSIGSPISDRWLLLLARVLRKPRVLHWVGSDIAALRNDKSLRSICSRSHVQNLAEVDWIRDELRAFGIRADIAPLAVRLPVHDRAPELPPVFTVLFYLPKTRAAFYGQAKYERLIREFADRNVRFLIVGGGECAAPANADVSNLGWRADLDDVYAQTTVLIRFPEHDGLSLMVLESLARARHVLWSKPFPHVKTVRSYPEAKAALDELLLLHERGELQPNVQGAHHVRAEYEPSVCIERITKIFERAEQAS